MTACKLGPGSCAQLGKGFESLQQMVNMEVTEPQTGFKIPTPAGIKRLTVNNIPQDYNDWKWLDTLKDFEDINVSVGGSGEETERCHVHDNKAEWIGVIDSDAAATLIHVFDNLAVERKKKVRRLWIIRKRNYRNYITYKDTKLMIFYAKCTQLDSSNFDRFLSCNVKFKCK